jgi:hypothetical protein
MFFIYSTPFRSYPNCSCSIIPILCQYRYGYQHHPNNNINSHHHLHYHLHHHYSVPLFLSFSSTNVIVYIWQTTHYNSLVLPSGYTYSCSLAPVIYEILRVKICTCNSTTGDLYTQNQYTIIFLRQNKNYLGLDYITHSSWRKASPTLNVYFFNFI